VSIILLTRCHNPNQEKITTNINESLVKAKYHLDSVAKSEAIVEQKKLAQIDSTHKADSISNAKKKLIKKRLKQNQFIPTIKPIVDYGIVPGDYPTKYGIQRNFYKN